MIEKLADSEGRVVAAFGRDAWGASPAEGKRAKRSRFAVRRERRQAGSGIKKPAERVVLETGSFVEYVRTTLYGVFRLGIGFQPLDIRTTCFNDWPRLSSDSKKSLGNL